MEVSVLNIYVPNTKAHTFIKETLLKLKVHIKSHTLIVEDVNTPLSPMDRFARQRLNREISVLTDVMSQMDLTDTIAYFTQTQMNISSSQYLSETNHILSHKANLNRCKTKWNKLCILSDHHVTMSR